MQAAIKVRGLLRNQDKILFCYNKEQGFYFLPGGSLAKEENSIQCLQREFQEECQLTISVGPLIGCLECHWQACKQRYQELNLVFEVFLPGPVPDIIPAVEKHISFLFLPVKAVLEEGYTILPTKVLSLLNHPTNSGPGYYFDNQLP